MIKVYDKIENKKINQFEIVATP